MSAPAEQRLLSLHDVAVALAKQLGIREGLWDLTIEFQVAIGNLDGPAGKAVQPGAAVTVARMGLAPAKVRGPLTIDASDIGRTANA